MSQVAAYARSFDKVNSMQGDMLLNTSFAPFYTDITQGVYHAGLLTPPCGQFNPRRFVFPDERFPVLRTLAEFGMGITGLDAKMQRSVDAVNVLAVRVCLAARAMFDLRRPWIIENPPTRSAEEGVFSRFYRPQLRNHASFFSLPCVQDLGQYTGALFAHSAHVLVRHARAKVSDVHVPAVHACGRPMPRGCALCACEACVGCRRLRRRGQSDRLGDWRTPRRLVRVAGSRDASTPRYHACCIGQPQTS